jgi:hypothetical protein
MYGGVDVQNRVFLTPALVRGEWSASRLSRFTPRKRISGTHWIGDFVIPRAGTDKYEGTILDPTASRTSNPSLAQLYRLRYRGSWGAELLRHRRTDSAYAIATRKSILLCTLQSNAFRVPSLIVHILKVARWNHVTGNTVRFPFIFLTSPHTVVNLKLLLHMWTYVKSIEMLSKAYISALKHDIQKQNYEVWTLRASLNNKGKCVISSTHYGTRQFK